MAGLRGNNAWLMGAKQSAKGTAATVLAAKTFKNAFTGGSINPSRNIDQLAETDSSRDQGISYVASSGVNGNPEIYARDDAIGLYLLAALGADAVTGTTPNFIHTLTPATVLPYMTFWRDIGDTLWEQFTDCKVGNITVSAGAGAPLNAAMTIMGRTPTRLTTDPSVSPAIALDSGYVYNFNDCTVTLSGGATALVSSFECSIENNLTVQQTDDVVPYDIVEGRREVTLSFDLIFETLAEYNAFQYGSTVGTTVTNAIYTTSANFVFTKGANNSIQFNFPVIAYQEFPVEPNAAGDPITVSVRAVAQRNVAGVVTATVSNQVATY